METLHETWRANFVKRWHSNVDMNHVEDYIAAHSARMATLVLRLWPHCRKELLAAIITHDIGERKVGDFPYDFKQANPDLAKYLGEEEQIARDKFMEGDWVKRLHTNEMKMLKLVDRIDSHLLVLMRNPKLAMTTPWQEQLYRDYEIAGELDVELELVKLISDAEEMADVRR